MFCFKFRVMITFIHSTPKRNLVAYVVNSPGCLSLTEILRYSIISDTDASDPDQSSNLIEAL